MFSISTSPVESVHHVFIVGSGYTDWKKHRCIKKSLPTFTVMNVIYGEASPPAHEIYPRVGGAYLELLVVIVIIREEHG